MGIARTLIAVTVVCLCMSVAWFYESRAGMLRRLGGAIRSSHPIAAPAASSGVSAAVFPPDVLAGGGKPCHAMDAAELTAAGLAADLASRTDWYGCPTRIGWSHCAVMNCTLAASCVGSHCCWTLLLQLLSDVSGEFRSRDVQHTLAFGSLLGALRAQHVIPWTADVDVAVAEPAYSQLLNPAADNLGATLQRELWERGVAFFADIIPRACFRRGHPLAKQLWPSYDPTSPGTGAVCGCLIRRLAPSCMTLCRHAQSNPVHGSVPHETL